MSKQWAKEQVKRNELQDAVERAAEWASENRQTAGIAAGALVASVFLVIALLWSIGARRDAAWERYGLAIAQAYAGRPEQALEQVKSLAGDAPSSPATAHALLLAGDIQFSRAKYAEAVASFEKTLNEGPRALHPFALSNLAITHESAKQNEKAIETARRFLDNYPDHFLAPQVHASLARSLQAAGQAEQARAALQKIAIQYGDSSWAAWAQSKIKGG